MASPDPKNLYPLLPPVTKLRDDCIASGLFHSYPLSFLMTTIQKTLENFRQEIQQNKWSASDLKAQDWLALLQIRCQERIRPKTVRVLNGTGVILHTGLGRAVLSQESLQAIQEQVAGYTLVEVERESGERNEREVHVKALLQEITGAESAVLVNNNAAATVIVLNTLALQKEVILSRGQLVEIGGSFRIPEIMECSQAILKEVGSTNKTRLSDYERAINEKTGMLMKIHTSNFKIMGFTETVPLEALVQLGKKYQLPVVDDLGAGAFINLSKLHLEPEPTVQDSLNAGADVVLFSGDKLIGACQAGIIVGKEKWMKQIRKNPLYRAMRVDKLTLTVLEQTLIHFLDETWAFEKIPTLRMMRESQDSIRTRAQAVKTILENKKSSLKIQLQEGFSTIGSGSLPTVNLPSAVLAITHPTLRADQLARKLRIGTPCVFTRVQENTVLLDFRTLLPDEEELLLQALQQIQ